MFNWVSDALSTVAGTAERVYGPEAIHPVGSRASKDQKPYSELTSQDLTWKAASGTCVETQSFYLSSESGHYGLVQVIYSSVGGLHTTYHFNVKVWHPTDTETNTWSSIALKNHAYDEKMNNFYADDVAVVLSEDGGSYKVKSVVDPDTVVNLTITRLCPGFKIGADGKTLFGTDAENPWGEMKHLFWPRNKVEGHIVVKGKTVDFAGSALYIMALQGMKPHHAAARWNFANFQGPTLSAVMMEFTTPPSYGSTTVNVGGIAKDGQVVTATTNNKAEHLKIQQDEEANWPEPETVRYTWKGVDQEGRPVEAVLEKDLGKRMDRVDVMHEVPVFVKKIVAGAAGTRPYIYQFAKPATLKVTTGDQVIEEEGMLFIEATFIS